jgi:hypothetical protein
LMMASIFFTERLPGISKFRVQWFDVARGAVWFDPCIRQSRIAHN